VSVQPGILAGLRVVEVSAFVAAPLGGATLAALGADVIRVDPIGGGIDAGRWPLGPDGRSLYWAGLNQGKRSLALDLRSEEGRELVARLITCPGDGGGILLKLPGGEGWRFRAGGGQLAGAVRRRCRSQPRDLRHARGVTPRTRVLAIRR